MHGGGDLCLQCVDPSGMTLTLDCCGGGKQDVLWFGPAGFPGCLLVELSDADPVCWLDVVAQFVPWRKLDGLCLRMGWLNS